jgi:biotin carboxylase
MGSNGKRAAGLAGLGLAGVLALSACNGNSGTPAAARVSADATGSAAVAAKANLAVISAKCGTVTAAGQIAAAKDMTSKAGRQALWAKCGVPKAKRSQVETQALAAAEKAHLVSGGHAARVIYFDSTLPSIIEKAEA